MKYIKHLSALFGLSAPACSPFAYGWCHTDHKDGKALRLEFRNIDYLKKQPYGASVKKMLKKLGLPLPKKTEIYRGTHHDMIFINSHGVIVRIGPTDVIDLLNPGILQPLGWLEDKNIKTPDGYPLTVAIYPGIELAKYMGENAEKAKDIRVLNNASGFLDKSRQNSCDCGTSNTGAIHIVDNEREEVAVAVLLDPDNKFNSSEGNGRKEKAELLAKTERHIKNRADALSLVVNMYFKDVKDVEPRLSAFQAHQPLRHMFWDAFANENKPDINKRTIFWNACAQATNQPQQARMPMWQSITNKNGKTTFVRKETLVPHVILYRPWTKKEADTGIQPISAAVKQAIAKTPVKIIPYDIPSPMKMRA